MSSCKRSPRITGSVALLPLLDTASAIRAAAAVDCVRGAAAGRAPPSRRTRPGREPFQPAPNGARSAWPRRLRQRDAAGAAACCSSRSPVAHPPAAACRTAPGRIPARPEPISDAAARARWRCRGPAARQPRRRPRARIVAPPALRRSAPIPAARRRRALLPHVPAPAGAEARGWPRPPVPHPAVRQARPGRRLERVAEGRFHRYSRPAADPPPSPGGSVGGPLCRLRMGTVRDVKVKQRSAFTVAQRALATMLRQMIAGGLRAHTLAADHFPGWDGRYCRVRWRRLRHR